MVIFLDDLIVPKVRFWPIVAVCAKRKLEVGHRLFRVFLGMLAKELPHQVFLNSKS